MPRTAPPARTSMTIQDVADVRGVAVSAVKAALAAADREARALKAWPRAGIPEPSRRRPRVEWDVPGPIEEYAAAGVRNTRPPELDNEEWLRREYVTRGRSLISIAAELRGRWGGTTSKDTVRISLERKFIPVRSGARPGVLDPYTLPQLLEKVEQAGSMEAAAEALGCSHMTLRGKIRQLKAKAAVQEAEAAVSG